MKVLESTQEFIERHPLSFLFFILGTLLILLGVTDKLNLPVFKQIVSNGDYRLASLVLGVIFLLVTIFLYYLPPQGTAVIPKELKKTFYERENSLSPTQQQILNFIKRRNRNSNSSIQQEILEQEFKGRSGAEIFFRLEQLYLLGFLEKQENGTSSNGIPRFIYRLSSKYRKEIGKRD
ncbi:hypothetical protein [Brasilonema sp. UFV-L1]|uniref:hypothetical protein n=1 Tax=Brasilonema sp. UFV-L1 TaxID=2234130 RepID=UPI00145E2AF8|nr:hypothetical protein [Brasilonema sp. UFV-L1]NMG07630.1 hypothetical protein [Brasilonema sp. UFV-L1]